jgi:hypothetical protein
MTYCGADCCQECGKLPECGGCEKCGGHPFGGSCIAERRADYSELKLRLIEKINALDIKWLTVSDLNLLNGNYVNLEYILPNGQKVRFLNDNDVYLGNQIEKTGDGRCYGVVANEEFILVCEYGCNGADPQLILYKHI